MREILGLKFHISYVRYIHHKDFFLNLFMCKNGHFVTEFVEKALLYYEI